MATRRKQVPAWKPGHTDAGHSRLLDRSQEQLAELRASVMEAFQGGGGRGKAGRGEMAGEGGAWVGGPGQEL